jgi:hypothetical protein
MASPNKDILCLFKKWDKGVYANGAFQQAKPAVKVEMDEFGTVHGGIIAKSPEVPYPWLFMV